MSFGIGSIVAGLIGQAGSALIGKFIGGPGGGGRAQLTNRQRKIRAGQPVKPFGGFPATQVGPTQFDFIPASFAPGAVVRGAAVAGGAALAAIPFFGNGNGRTVGTILTEARENTGRSATSRAIRLAARVCGLETTADTFGISVEDVCFIVVNSGRRRARGISAADMRRTRSTLRKLNTMRKSFRSLMSAR